MAPKNNFKTYYALSIAWQLGFLIAVPIAGFIFLGYLADKSFNTLPFFVLIGLVVGTAITVYEIYHMLIPLINKNKDD